MSIKLFTAADLHLGRSSSQNGNTTGGIPASKSWEILVSRAIRDGADAVLLAGDVIDRENRFFEAKASLLNGLKKLITAEIPVVMVSGNHDYDVLPEIMNEFLESKPHEKWITLLGQSGTWETMNLTVSNGKSVTITGWSFPDMYVSTSPLDQLKQSELKQDNSVIHIGLLHGDVNQIHSNYGPISSSDLKQFDPIDAWVLGHVHKPWLIEEKQPRVYYPGSLQALSPKEKGPHGFTEITIEPSGEICYKNVHISTIEYHLLNVKIHESDDKPAFYSSLQHAIREDIELRRRNELYHVVYDIIVTGERERLDEIDEWIWSRDAEMSQQTIGELEIMIRTVENHCQYKVTDLESYARQTNPAGVLAQAILDLKRGDSENPFLDTLRMQMKERIEEIAVADVFSDIGSDVKDVAKQREKIDEMLISECNRYLSEMVKIKQEVG